MSRDPLLPPLSVTKFTLVSAAGSGIEATARSLIEMNGGLRPARFAGATYPTWIGEVDGVEDITLPPDLARFSCRNNQLAETALQTDGFAAAVAEAIACHGADRVAVVLGTTTSGVREGEIAFAERRNDDSLPSWFDHATSVDYHALCSYVAARLGASGPALTVSTACSSSSRAVLDAWQLIAAGWCDAAVVGGVDTLCKMTLHGFGSLELLGRDPCAPFDADRGGISLGEAAGFLLVERADSGSQRSEILIVGAGSSSDAFHMSAPDPEGTGARMAMRRALDSAGLSAGDIDYVSMHGTGTRLNDASEDVAVAAEIGTATPCSSIKGWLGHCLGAAGAASLVVSALALERGFLPGNLNLSTPDPALRCRIQSQTDQNARPAHVLINAFGFGGNNCSLILGAAH